MLPEMCLIVSSGSFEVQAHPLCGSIDTFKLIPIRPLIERTHSLHIISQHLVVATPQGSALFALDWGLHDAPPAKVWSHQYRFG